MTTEEKAKAYAEVREKIALRFGSNVAEEIFSEFEMSKDERIRKELKQLISCMHDSDPRKKDWIAWLEKQGEQKPTETVKWSAQEEYCICELEAMVKEAWRKAEKVRNDVTIKKMQELMFFLKTLNPNKKPQHIKPAEWSEEDEDTLSAIIAIIRKLYNGTNIEEKKYYNVLINWLKSLKQRYTWKPSNEQMHALEQVYNWYNNDFAPSETLTSLYNDLKKLKGESYDTNNQSKDIASAIKG